MGQKILTSAVVGLGNIGLGYDLVHYKDYVQTHTKAYLKHKGFQLSFGVDPDKKKRMAFEHLTRRRAYQSLEDAAKDFPSVDVLSVCVSPEHRASLWDVLGSMDLKVAVLEKPLAKALTDGKRILSWSVKNRIKMCVNYIRRFEPSAYTLKSLFENKKYGRVVGVDIRYNGGFYNNASHYIDLMLLLFGKPKKVRHTRAKKDGQDLQADFYMEYQSFKVHGMSVEIDCPVGEITFWCERAQVSYRRFGQQIDIQTPRPDPVFRKFNELALNKTIKTSMPYAMAHMAENVYQFCCGKEQLLSDGQSAFETLKVCEHILSNR